MGGEVKSARSFPSFFFFFFPGALRREKFIDESILFGIEKSL